MEKKYLTIYKDLASAIRNGIYPVDSMLPSELELARLYKASRPTIAKALDMLRAEKAIERTAGYGTVILSSNLTKKLQIGLLIPRLGSTEIFEPIVNAMADACKVYAMELIPPPKLPLSQSYEETTEYICSRFIQAQVDGIIFAPVEHIENGEQFNRSILAQLKSAGIPAVLLDRDIAAWPQQSQTDLVGIDNIQAGFVMAQHLIQQGCEKLLFLTRPLPASTVNLRIMGCREALLDAGLSPDALTVAELDSHTELTADIVLRHETEGVICANDATAATILRMLVDAGIDVPGEIRVVGFDDVKYASLLSVPLTTYRQPCSEIGQAVITTLKNRFETPMAAPHRITLQGALIMRKSSK